MYLVRWGGTNEFTVPGLSDHTKAGETRAAIELRGSRMVLDDHDARLELFAVRSNKSHFEYTHTGLMQGLNQSHQLLNRIYTSIMDITPPSLFLLSC